MPSRASRSVKSLRSDSAAALVCGGRSVRRDREDVSKRASDRLTALERETLALFATGRSYTEIAEARGKSSVTIRNTLYRIQDKLGIKSKQELVIWAVQNDLVNDVAVGRDSQPVPKES